MPDMSGILRDPRALEPGSEWRRRVEAGATVLLLHPGQAAVDLFPNDVETFHPEVGEYADWSPAVNTPLVAGLEKMDLKWWGRKNDWRVFVASGAHRLRKGGSARELVRFIPPHSYVPPEKLSGEYMTVLFEVPVGKGKVWVCDLDLDEAAPVDPAARLFATHLLNALNADSH